MLYGLGNTVVQVVGRDVRSFFFQRRYAVFHGGGMGGKGLEHRKVIGAVAKHEDFVFADAEPLGQYAQRIALGGLGVVDFDVGAEAG